MSEERMTEFDLKVRSMLQDAEERVPSGVWKAVSLRLPEKAVFPWGWTVAGLAFACLCTALILGNFNTVPEVRLDKAVAVVTDRPASLVAEVLPVLPVLETEFPDGPQSRTEVPAIGDEPAVETVSAASAVPASDAAPSGTVAAESRPAESVPESASERDVFGEMAMEDAQSGDGDGWSFDLNGSIVGSENKRTGIARRSSGDAVRSSRDNITEFTTSSYGIPVTLGVGARYYLTKRFSIASGVDFSLLTRTFSGDFTPAGSSVLMETDITHTMIYAGIPLDLYYDIVNNGSMKFYVFGGGEAEYGIVNRYALHDIDRTLTRKVSGMQYSLDLGIGVEFGVSEHLGIYLDPGVNYYFNCDQPKNIRTERPFMFTLNAGLRFNLRPER